MNALQAIRPGSLFALVANLAGLAGGGAPPRWRAVAPRRTAAGEAALSLPLARAATHWVQRPRGLLVACETGTLWLTFDGEERDIVLDAGESHHCASDARLAIHALAEARLSLRAAPARC